MMRKRILAFVLAAALIGSLLVTAAVAEEDGAPAETAQSGESAPTENESGEAAARRTVRALPGRPRSPSRMPRPRSRPRTRWDSCPLAIWSPGSGRTT